MSAIQPPEAGRVALANIPFSYVAITSNKNSNDPVSRPEIPKEITVEKIIRERAQPTNPTMTIFFLPTLSLKVPQIGLAIIQARAEIPKIAPICCSLSPRSLPKGGIVRNTTD